MAKVNEYVKAEQRVLRHLRKVRKYIRELLKNAAIEEDHRAVLHASMIENEVVTAAVAAMSIMRKMDGCSDHHVFRAYEDRSFGLQRAYLKMCNLA